jgi:hypothetical protein
LLALYLLINTLNEKIIRRRKMVLRSLLGTAGAPLRFTKFSINAALFAGKKFMRKSMMLCMLFLPAGSALADFTAILDLDRFGLLEGHAEYFISPSATSQVLTNDVNDLALTGNDLLLDHVIMSTSPSTLTFDVTITVDPSASGSTLFNNPSEAGDVVFFAFEELGLGGSYAFDGVTVMVGTSGALSAVTGDLFVSGDGSAGDPMFFDILFSDAAAFDMADTLTMSAEFSSTSAVPVPAAVWLFGSGLLGLVGIARRKARA